LAGKSNEFAAPTQARYPCTVLHSHGLLRPIWRWLDFMQGSITPDDSSIWRRNEGTDYLCYLPNY